MSHYMNVTDDEYLKGLKEIWRILTRVEDPDSPLFRVLQEASVVDIRYNAASAQIEQCREALIEALNLTEESDKISLFDLVWMLKEDRNWWRAGVNARTDIEDQRDW